MSDVKVSGLPSDSALDNNHYVPVNDPSGPTTKRTLLSTLAAFFFTQANIPTGSGSPVTRTAEHFYHWAFSGLVFSADSLNSTRNGSMTSGVYYCNGLRLSLSAVTARSYTASKDTYVIADDAGAITYTEVANGGTAPTLASNQMFLALVITGASAITTVYQMSPRTPREIARVKLTQGASDNIAALFLAKRYLRLKARLVPTGSVTSQLRFNNDSGSNYAFRYTIDNTVGATGTSTNNIGNFDSALNLPNFVTGDMFNEAATVKLGHWTTVNGTTSAAAAAAYVEFYGKWVNTSVQITQINFINTGGGDFTTGTEIIIEGND